MNQIGTVKSINDKTTIVSVRRASSCGDNCAGCSVACKVPIVEVKADTIPNIAVGDEVEIFSEDVNVLKYSFVLYGVPLAIMVAVIFLVSFLIKGEKGQLYAALLGILSLALSFFILRKYDRMETSKKSFKYVILRKIDKIASITLSH